MRIIRYILWGLVAVMVATFTYLQFSGQLNSSNSQNASGEKLGGEFQLVRHDGSAITDKDLLGKPHAVFFGFTNCPEVCPTTLFELTTWLAELGDDGDNLGVYFVTVDPTRDTPEFLSEYLTSFDPRITGITGSKDAVEATLRAFKIYYNRVPLEDGDYTMDHTASIYLINAKGDFVRTIAYGEDSKTAISKLRKMLN